MLSTLLLGHISLSTIVYTHSWLVEKWVPGTSDSRSRVELQTHFSHSRFINRLLFSSIWSRFSSCKDCLELWILPIPTDIGQIRISMLKGLCLRKTTELLLDTLVSWSLIHGLLELWLVWNWSKSHLNIVNWWLLLSVVLFHIWALGVLLDRLVHALMLETVYSVQGNVST
jgi:hypothetical protein